MKSASSELIALLNGRAPVVWADLYTFTLKDGITQLRWTSSDRPITFGGVTWGCGPLITRDSISFTIGVNVDSLSITLNTSRNSDVNGSALMQFIASSGFDQATLLMERAYLPNWASPVTGKIYKFSGTVNDIELTRYEAKITVNTDVQLLNINLPRNVYQPGCLNSLFDGTCGLIASAFNVASTVSGAPSRYMFSATGLAQADGYFNLGVCIFNSGPNEGTSRSIRAQAAGLITLTSPAPEIPGIGDSITLRPGCDKTQNTCTVKFSNLPRYRGFPYIPVAQTVT